MLVSEVSVGPCDAAHSARLHAHWCRTLPQDKLSGAPANIDHQPAFLSWWQTLGDTLVYEPGFFPARDDIDRKTEHTVAVQ